MPKWIAFALGALFDFVVAAFAYFNGSFIVAIVLTFAGICFAIAAIGSALKKG
jgi:hypothetical protein